MSATKRKNRFQKKHSKALWVSTFPKQVKKTGARQSAGMAHRSDIGKVRDAVYLSIKALFLTHRFYCEPCMGCLTQAVDVHHKKGKDGLLLFDVRYFLPVCRDCHTFIHDNPDWAIQNGFMIARNK